MLRIQRPIFIVVFVLVVSAFTTGSWAQSALDGVSFDASIYNLPDSVGSVRLIDVGESDCQSEIAVVGDDKPGEDVCLVETNGDPVAITFNGGPQAVGGALITPTATPFTALGDSEDVITAFNLITDTTVPMPTWSTTSGDLIEFTIRTADDSFPAEDDLDFWGFSATGIQYPGAKADSEIGLPFDEELGNYTNFYFWYETEDGPITEGYELGLPEAVGVGRHPTDPDREVLYPIYSTGQADEQTDTVAGGTLDFYSHGSILNSAPEIANVLNLADLTVNPDVVDALELTGFGLAVLVEPPELDEIVPPGLLGDFDGDMLFTAADIDLLSAQVGQADLVFDLTGDGSVTNDDREFWIADVAGSLNGDADLNGTVEFADFLSLSNNFGKDGGWAEGDFDGSGGVAFPDFLLLSNSFGQSVGAVSSVPEPNAQMLLVIALVSGFFGRRSRKR